MPSVAVAHGATPCRARSEQWAVLLDGRNRARGRGTLQWWRRLAGRLLCVGGQRRGLDPSTESGNDVVGGVARLQVSSAVKRALRDGASAHPSHGPSAARGRDRLLNWRHRILYGLIILGILAGLPDLHARIDAEQANNRVELVADEPTFTELAQAYGVPPLRFLLRMKQAGVQALGVYEDTLASLNYEGRLTILSGAQWLDARRSANQPPPPLAVDPFYTYVLTKQPALAAWLPAAIRRAAGPGIHVRTMAEDGQTVVAISELPALTSGLPLGFAPGAFALARSAGMHIVPRPEDSPTGLSASGVRALFGSIASSGVPVDAILFAGPSTQAIPGYPQAFHTLLAEMRRPAYLLAVLETPQQLSNVDNPGTRHLSLDLNEHTVRVYSVPDWMLATYTTDQTAAAIFDSVNERNLRIVYAHPVAIGPHPLATTVQLYADVTHLLRTHGYILGQPRAFPQVRVHTSQRVLQGLAAVAAGLLLLEFLFPGVARWGYQPLTVLGGVVGLLCLGSATLSVEVVGLALALTFGGLSVYYVADFWFRERWAGARPGFGTLWWRSASLSVTMAGITFAGVLLIATLLGDTQHFLEWEYFRGVKATYLGIPFLAALAFLATVGIGAIGGDGAKDAVLAAADPVRGGAAVGREGGEQLASAAGARQYGRPGRADFWREIRRVGEVSVKVKYAAVLVVIAAIGWYYLHRSGNVSHISSLEQAMRSALQSLLTDRPREKEFLVGYPSVFLAVFFASRRQRWPFLLFLLGASTGVVSLVDAFDHIRTPFLNSVHREFYGLVLGMITGTLALVVFYAAARLVDRWVPVRARTALAGADPIGMGRMPETDHRGSPLASGQGTSRGGLPLAGSVPDSSRAARHARTKTPRRRSP